MGPVRMVRMTCRGAEVALSVGVQKMVRSDLGGRGVAFSINTETAWTRSF